MPRNGAGVFSLVNNTFFPPVNGVLATSTDWSTFIIDIQNALTQSVSSDGQTPFTGNLPMGNNKITGLAPGTAATDAATYGQVIHAAGQGRLVRSGGNLVFQPFNGNQIAINGEFQTIPAAGVSLAPGAAVAGTTYFIYAFMVAAVMTLEFSTTVHATDVTTGVEIKSGDATRSLVGMARPIAGPLWTDTNAQRFVISWFNKRPRPLANFFTTNRGFGSAITGEVNAEIRNEFLHWAGEAFQSSINGMGGHSITNSLVDTWIGVNGAQVDALSAFQQSTGGNLESFSVYYTNDNLGEGYNYTTLLSDNPSGAGVITYSGGASGTRRCALFTTIQG